MLVQFAVENHRSIRERVVLNLRAAQHVLRPSNRAVDVPGVGPVLKVAALYGANASGKSNIAEAWTTLCELATHGVGVGAAIGVSPFKLDAGSRSAPSRFGAHIALDGRLWAYELAVSRRRVESEALRVRDRGVWQIVFERTDGVGPQPAIELGQGVALDADRQSFYRHVAEGTRHEQPFLAELRARNAHELGALSRYLLLSSSKLPPGHQTSGAPMDLLVKWVASQLLTRTVMLGLASAPGTGVTGLRFRSEDKRLEEHLNGGGVVDRAELDQRLEDGLSLDLAYEHEGGLLEFEELSAGTQRLLGLSFAFQLLASTADGPNPTVFLDELDRSFHTSLTRALVSLATDLCSSGSQLVLTTHDTNLLDASVLGVDGIWFVEKDGEGATRLYSLAEFDPDHLESLADHLEEGYLQGRFGAIPFIGDLAHLGWRTP